MNQQRILRKRRCQDSCPFWVVMLGAAAMVFRRMSLWLMRSFQIYTIRSVLSFIFFIYQMKLVGTFSCCLSQICSEPFKGLRGRRGMFRSNSASYYFSLESPYQLWIQSLRVRQKSKLTCSLLLNRESRGFYLSSSRSMLMALYWSRVVLASSLCQYSAEMLAKQPRQSQYILLESSMTLSSLLFLLCFISSNCSFKVLTWPSICLITDYLPNNLVDSSSSLILLLSNSSFVFYSSATTKLKLSLTPWLSTWLQTGRSPALDQWLIMSLTCAFIMPTILLIWSTLSSLDISCLSKKQVPQMFLRKLQPISSSSKQSALFSLNGLSPSQALRGLMSVVIRTVK